MSPVEMLQAVIGRQGIRTALITTHYFDGYGGSPLVALDVAEALRRAGVEVHIAACRIAPPLSAAAAARGFPLHDLHEGARPPGLPQEVDLVWGQHWSAYGLALLEFGIAARGIILSSLSPFEPLEALPFLADEADLLLFNSEENLAVQTPSLPAGTPRHVLPNSLPAAWFEGVSSPREAPLRVLFVSNDPPTDLAAALLLLEADDIACVAIGAHSEQRLVDEALLDDHDAVVTMGHTVQKALARQRPVFVYGRFGGPGWLTPDNLPLALHHNFSGRGFGRREAPHLAAEFKSGFSAARDRVGCLAALARERFCLETHLAMRLEGVPRLDAPRRLNLARHRPAMLLAQGHANLSSGAAPYPAVRNIPGGETLHLMATLRTEPPAAPADAVLFAKPRLTARVLPTGRLRMAGTLRVRRPDRVANLLLETPDGGRAPLRIAWPAGAPRRLMAPVRGWLPAAAGEGVARLLLQDVDGQETCLAELDVICRAEG